jgi:hypothetical protein
MNAKQYDVIVEAFSRRKFLRTGTLAASALIGVTARAQERASIQAAEHDHSSSDPGQENSQWLRRAPVEIVQAHLGFDRASLAQIPAEKLAVL